MIVSNNSLSDSALDYHRRPTPGKIAIVPTKPLTSQRDLALAYSPGVAAACEAIVADPSSAREYTIRGNLVAVITNGTAVLGLGAIGPLAAKPVMEGKAVLFKKFAGIDAIDLEIAENDPDKLVEIIAALEPSFGAINLEDIKAPECFEIEKRLRLGHALVVGNGDADAHTRQQPPHKLRRHVQICETRYALPRLPVQVNGEATHIDLSTGLTQVGNPLVVREAVLNGAGIAPLPRHYCRSQIADGSLIEVFGHVAFEPDASTLSAVYPGRRLVSPRLRVFLDFLVEASR